MAQILKALVILAVLALVLAVVATLHGPVLGVSAEAYSRASNNVVLITIAMALLCKEKTATS